MAVLSVSTHGFQLNGLSGKATGIEESELLHDRQVNLTLEHGMRALVFIHNIGLVGKDREEVDQVMGRLSHELCSRGLLTPELSRVAVLRHLGDRT